MGLTKLQREIVSRAAMAVLGTSLLYGGFRCLKTGWAFQKEYEQKRSSYRGRGNSGAGLPYLAGAVLVIAGAPFALAAVVPSGWFGRIMGPPNTFRLHENPSADNPRGRW